MKVGGRVKFGLEHHLGWGEFSDQHELKFSSRVTTRNLRANSQTQSNFVGKGEVQKRQIDWILRQNDI